MAGTYAAFKNNETLETKGIILDLGEAGKFRIARAGGANQSFNKTVARLTKPIRRAIQTETIDQKTADKVMVDAYVESVLLGWEGVTGPDGQPLEYNKENATKLFTDLPDLFQEIMLMASRATLFREDVKEADAGN